MSAWSRSPSFFAGTDHTADERPGTRHLLPGLAQQRDRPRDGIGRHLAEDVAQLPADGQAHGRAAAVEEHRRIFDSFAEVSECYTIEQIVVVGDLAVAWGTYDITVTDATTGETSQGTALPYLFAYERDGGLWRVTRMSWEAPA